MKRQLIYGITILVLGLLISLGPQFLFKVCPADEEGAPLCHWSAQAELGLGMIIAVLGICFIVFDEPQVQFGLSIGVFLTCIVVLLIPHLLIGGCGMMSMACRRVAFPALTVEGVILLVFIAVVVAINELKKPPVAEK